MARYARGHNTSQAARHFGCCWATIQAAAERIERYEQSDDISVLQNKPRGKTNRTLIEIEEHTVEICQESFDPPRPQNRRHSAAKVACLLLERHQVSLHRSTAWRILYRRQVWEPDATQKVAVQRFERSRPNELWQIDLIEKEPTAIGNVYGVPILDDHSRYMLGLRLFFTRACYVLSAPEDVSILLCHCTVPSLVRPGERARGRSRIAILNRVW